MQNLTKTNNLPFKLAYFQVEELEERFENCWQGMEHADHGYWSPTTGEWVSNPVHVPCGTPAPDPYRHLDSAPPE